jgi:1,4-dihydroxy-2-naphthoyl-CoA hydrolase
MSIWFKKDLKLEDFTWWNFKTMSEFLGIKFTEVGEDYLKISMPVEDKTRRPFGFLHGGASVTLAETAGSVASALVIDYTKYLCFGIEVNANHIRSAKEGMVIGICKPIHLGASTHVWDVRITDEQEKLICISRLTVAILARRDEEPSIRYL